MSAAPQYFDSIKIGSSDYVDGALGANNPVFQLVAEAADVWEGKLLGCIVSIGTGLADLEPFNNHVFTVGKSLGNITTETQATARKFHSVNRQLNKAKGLYRFEVIQGMANIELGAADKIDEIIALTEYHLEDPKVGDEIGACAKSLVERMGSSLSL